MDFITQETGPWDHSHSALLHHQGKTQPCHKCPQCHCEAIPLGSQAEPNMAMLLHSSHKDLSLKAPHTYNLFWAGISQVKRTDLKTDKIML